MHRQCQNQCQIEEEVVREQHLANDWYVLHKIRKDRAREGILQVIAQSNESTFLHSHEFTGELADTCSKYGESKSGHILIGSKSYGYEPIYGRCHSSSKECSKNRQNYGDESRRSRFPDNLLIIERSCKTEST